MTHRPDLPFGNVLAKWQEAEDQMPEHMTPLRVLSEAALERIRGTL